MKAAIIAKVCLSMLLMSTIGWAQETSQEAPPPSAQTTTQEVADEDIAEKLQEHAQEIGETLDQSETAKELSTGVLDPIYKLAEFMAFETFYWVAFAIMVAGVISFAFQLVLGKFFLLFRGSLNVKEILSDFLGLLISLVGLVLTTQAATQNSTFPESPSAVLSATVVGAILGLVFYWWGQKQEFHAVRGKSAESKE